MKASEPEDVQHATNRLDLESLGSWPTLYAQKLPGMMRSNERELCPRRTGSWLQMSWLSLRNNWLKFENSGELPIILEESMEYTSNELKGNRKMSTCDPLDLESLGSWLTNCKPLHSVTNTTCWPDIVWHSLRTFNGIILSCRVAISFTYKWFFTQISIVCDNVSSQVSGKKRPLFIVRDSIRKLGHKKSHSKSCHSAIKCHMTLNIILSVSYY